MILWYNGIMFKKYVQWRLERYVKKYFKRYHPTLIVVVGSVGKTTTKTAIANVLVGHYRVQLEPGNHNSPLSVPLAIMGVKYPPMDMVHSIGTWRQVFKAMKSRIKAPQGVDVIVQELGTDHPGDLAVYEKYLKPDIAVVTAVTPEHMENFPGGLNDVAKEELSITNNANLSVVNYDDVDNSFAQFANTNNMTDYGIGGGENQIAVVGGDPLGGYQVEFTAANRQQPIRATVHVLGNHMLRSIAAALTIGVRMGIPDNELATAVEQIRPVAGRMNPLPGRNDSVIIDDTYNSSPVAAIAALQTLYQIETPQRIAVLGSMNELGNFTQAAHQQVGDFCDPMMLDWVITIGDDANNYLLPAAKKKGCQTRAFRDPVAAGTFISQIMEDNAVVLVKGSQNGVYAEEATKILLRNPSDKDKLVRQDGYWLNRKQQWYDELSNRTEESLDNE